MKRSISTIYLFSLLTSLSAQNQWEFVEETNLQGNISGTIQQGRIFKTFANDFYIVNELTLQLVLELSPEVTILKRGDDFKLVIEGFDEPVICKKLENVIETKIDGDFNGWEGETIFKFQNGQIWQQSSYEYKYKYIYSPTVFLFKFNNKWMMSVEGVDKTIQVLRLK